MGTPSAEIVLPSESSSTLNEQPSHVMRIDIHHPYFLHNSDSPGMNLITSTFDGKGFPGWRRSILISLSAKMKLGFINGTCAAPDPQNPQYAQWSCCNDMDENQRETYAHNSFSNDAMGFMANSQGRNFQRSGNFVSEGNFSQDNFAPQRNLIPNQRGGRGNYKNKGRRNKYDPNVSCTHCGKTGHVYDDCYRRIGYPNDFEFTKSIDFNPSKPKRFQGSANRAFPSEDNSEIQGMTHQQGTPSNIFYQLNKEQYAALVKQVARDLKMEQNNTKIGFNASAISGTVQKYSTSCLTVFNSSTWIIDLGGSEHMCFDSQFFTSLTPLLGELNFSNASKSNVFPILKDFLVMVERQFQTQVKCIRSNNAMELGKGHQEAQFLKSQGIMH
ncbi:hypothetical protein KY284_033062 [Solanum tuberosum]|nr:hypothetical protein KY284_033062 [Solanum tuberosum]